MKHAFRGSSIVLLLGSIWPTGVFGQYAPYNPYGPVPYQPMPYVPPTPPPPPTAREKRQERDKAVAFLGPETRPFIESCDEASVAVFACSKPVALKLSEFYASGGFQKIAKYREVLLAIANDGGDDCALYIVQNGDKLHNEDNLDAFLAKPLDYAMRLRDLESGGAEVKAARLSAAQSVPLFGITDWKPVAGIGGIVAIVGLALWRIRQRRRAATVGA